MRRRIGFVPSDERGFFWRLERWLTVLVAVIGMGQWSTEFNRGTFEIFGKRGFW